MNILKSVTIYPVFLFLAVVSFLALFLNGTSPHTKLLGTWEEVAWEYEKSDMWADKSQTNEKIVEPGIKEEIMENRLIHEAEYWTFSEKNKLHMVSNKRKSSDLTWQLKGRGHVLELLHSDGTKEFFNIQELTNDRLVLYFELDMQIKGIVKMIYKRRKDVK